MSSNPRLEAQLIYKNGNVCFYCQLPKNGSELTLDHYYPKRFKIYHNNKVLACRQCNKMKADLAPEEFFFLIPRIASVKGL